MYVLPPNTELNLARFRQQQYNGVIFALNYAAPGSGAGVIETQFITGVSGGPLVPTLSINVATLAVNPLAGVPKDAQGRSTEAFTLTGVIDLPESFLLQTRDIAIMTVAGETLIPIGTASGTGFSVIIPSGTEIGAQPFFTAAVVLNSAMATEARSAAAVLRSGPVLEVLSLNGVDESGRFFPDATAVGGNFNDIVTLKVKVHGPNAPGTLVHFKAFDIDDPSSDESPVDPNGPAGNDNRGEPGRGPLGNDGLFVDERGVSIEDFESTTAATADDTGVATIRLVVTHQPGDNFQIRFATTRNEVFDGVTAGPTGDFTRSFTVWRRLHVEIDSMGSAGANDNAMGLMLTGGSLDLANNLTFVSFDDALLPQFSGADQFARGRLIADQHEFEIAGSVPGVLTLSGQHPDLLNSLPLAVIVQDDDVGSVLAPSEISLEPVMLPSDLMGDLQGTLARSFYAEASIEFVAASSPTRNIDLPFAPQLEEGSALVEIMRAYRHENSSTSYWSSYLVAGFQGESTADGDGEASNVQAGVTGVVTTSSPEATTGSFVFLEVCRKPVHDPLEMGGQSCRPSCPGSHRT